MKNLLLASILSGAVGAAAVPILVGPMHYAITKPQSFYAVLPAQIAVGATTVSVGQAPLDFVLTDVNVGRYVSGGDHVDVLANNAPVLTLPANTNGQPSSVHMTTGVLIPAGATIAVRLTELGSGRSWAIPVTLVGYSQ